MELVYKGKLLSLTRPIEIKCSDGKEYLCTQKQLSGAFKIYEQNQLIVEGTSRSGVWKVMDSIENKLLFTTCGILWRFAIDIEGRKIEETEFEQEFGWRPINNYTGFYKWGLKFPKKEKYLMELAYGYLKDHWQGD